MPVNSFENYPMSWKPVIADRSGTIYTQLIEQLVEDIRSGRLKPGDKLPPQRELADYLDLHLSTITRVYKFCEKQGLICAKVGQGTFVSSDVNASDTLLYSTDEETFIQMGTILPPYNENQKIIEFTKELLSQPDIESFLKYRSPVGTFIQRKNFSVWSESLGISVCPEHVLFATGAQNAVCAALLALFRPGDRIGVNALTFSGLKSITKMIGVQLIPLPERNGQFDWEILESFCRTEKIKGFYMIPDQHNPTAYTMSSQERNQLASLAVKHSLIIIEDAINLMFAAKRRRPIYSYAPQNTVFILSTSKFLSAGLRTAYIAVGDAYYSPLKNALYNMNLMVSPFNLEIVNRIITSSLLNELVTVKRQELKERDGVISSILGKYKLYGEPTCNFRWLSLPTEWNSADFERAALKKGIQVFCADRFAIGKTVPPKAVRLSISSPATQDELRRGLLKIRELL